MRKRWYLLAYDIRDPRRLRRLHYLLSKQSLSLQNSVFLMFKNEPDLQELLRSVRSKVNADEDDVRLYPITHPNVIWSAGKQADAMSDLYSGVPKAKRQKSNGKEVSRLLMMINRIFNKGAEQ